ncbi:hypothetical protein DMN50_17575 [Priestia megaterium]|nr:hypothetical protein DMN50_17575 [Priestia megaterium]
MQKGRRNPAFLFLCNFKVVCIFWRNAANYLLFLKETCLTRKKEEKGRKRRCFNLEIFITLAAGVGFLFSFYLFYIHPVISKRKGKPLSESESQSYILRGVAVVALLASFILGSYFL